MKEVLSLNKRSLPEKQFLSVPCYNVNVAMMRVGDWILHSGWGQPGGWMAVNYVGKPAFYEVRNLPMRIFEGSYIPVISEY